MAKKILIVDDEKDIISLLKYNLQAEGYETISAMDGEAAIKSAKKEQPDLILLDIMLPEQRGSDILRALRNENKDLIPNTKVIVLTNFEQDETTRADMQKQADGYLVKAEITPRKLIEVIQKLDTL